MRGWLKASNNLLLNETCKFKLEPKEGTGSRDELLKPYSKMVKALEKAMEASLERRLHGLQVEGRNTLHTPPHYITAITQALAIYNL